MPTRELENPQWDVSRKEAQTILSFWVPGSKFGGVRIVLDTDEAERLFWKAITKQDPPPATVLPA